MRAISLVGLICVVPVLGGCPLDSLFVRNHYVHSRMPYLSSYEVPRGESPARFWKAKKEYFTQIAVESDDLTDRELELVNHLYDYKDLFEQLEAGQKEYNRIAHEENLKNGYER
jgi:hypothetical protein